MVIAKERVMHVTLMQDMEIDKLQVKVACATAVAQDICSCTIVRG